MCFLPKGELSAGHILDKRKATARHKIPIYYKVFHLMSCFYRASFLAIYFFRNSNNVKYCSYQKEITNFMFIILLEKISKMET